MDSERIITQTLAGQYLGVSRQAIKDAMQRRKILGFFIGSHWYCDKYSVARYGLKNDYEETKAWIATWSQEDQQRLREEETQSHYRPGEMAGETTNFTSGLLLPYPRRKVGSRRPRVSHETATVSSAGRSLEITGEEV